MNRKFQRTAFIWN